MTAVAALLGLALGAWRTGAALERRATLARAETVSGMVMTEPRRSPRATWFQLGTSAGTIRVVVLSGAEVALGETIEVRCGHGSGVEPGRKMPVCMSARVKVRHAAAGSSASFARWRAGILDRIDARFDPPVSAWIAGLLLGEDGDFSAAWRDAFRRTGTSHLTAVSGQNLTMVLMVICGLGSLLPIGRRPRTVVNLGSVGAYVLLVGAGGPVVRAAVMVAAVYGANELLGRRVAPIRALFVAVIAIVLVDPLLLVFDRGFQLSVLAMFGLAALEAPLAESVFRRLPEPLRVAAAQSAAATLATAPLVAWMSGGYSIVALLANVLVSPFIPPIMLAGALTVMAPFGGIAASVVAPFVALPLLILRALAALPFASIGGWAAWIVLLLIELAALAAVFRWRREKTRSHFLHEEVLDA